MPHIHEKIDYTAEVFVVHRNKVLLRKHDKYGIWLGVGGHIELDEDPNQAAVREVREEVGLEVKLYDEEPYKRRFEGALIPPQFLDRHRINDKHEHIALVYIATSESDSLRLSETERSDGVKWFNKDELEEPKFGIKDTVRMYARTALEKVLATNGNL